MPANAPCRHFDTIDSTNAEALRLAEAGAISPLWITAHQQTAGRGRAGRHWESAAGNLMATLLLDIAAPAQIATQLGFVAALAAYDCAEICLGTSQDLSLKWPNDLLLANKKLAGLLLETIPNGSPRGGTRLAIGCGLNLVYAPSDTPYGATTIAAHAKTAPPPPAIALDALDAAFFKWLGVWALGTNFSSIRETWTLRAHPAGSAMTVDSGSGPQTATFIELASDGALVVETAAGRPKKLHAGDVRVLYDAT